MEGIESQVASSPLDITARLLASFKRNGLSSGAFSDVTVRILGREYQLHRVVLYANRFFKAALEGSIASQAGLTVQRYSKSLRKGKSTDYLRGRHVLDVVVGDGVTSEGVEVILERIYGQFGHRVSDATFMTYLPAAYFFSDEDLCDQCGIYIRSIAYSPENILSFFQFASGYDFGPYSELLLRNCLIYLCKEGTANPALNPTDIYSKLDYNWLAQIIGSDVFYVKSEADRFVFLTQAIKARDAAEFGRIRDFLSGSTIMNFSDSNVTESGNKVFVAESMDVDQNDELHFVGQRQESQVVPLNDANNEIGVEDQEYLEGEQMAESDEDNQDNEMAVVRKRESAVTFDSKRKSLLEDIVEDLAEEDPSAAGGLTISTAKIPNTTDPSAGPPTTIPSTLTAFLPITSSPLATVASPSPLSSPHALRIRNVNHKKSFKERRDASRFLGSSDINSTPNAIETISNGVIYTHMNPATLSKLKAEGVISPLVLGIQHRASIDLQNKIKKSSVKSVSLGIKYVNDRVGVSEKIRRDLEQDDTVGPASVLPPPCFYDWVFLDPFRHKLSEVQPFRFAVEFVLTKVVGSKGKLYSAPVPYAGSLWYLMVRNESVKNVGKFGVYVYRKQDKKLSGYTDYRTPVQFWGKVCAYIHNPRNSVVNEPYAFETISQVAHGSEAKFLGDVNRICGEDLMTELKGLDKGGVEAGVLRCSVVLALF